MIVFARPGTAAEAAIPAAAVRRALLLGERRVGFFFDLVLGTWHPLQKL
jgi:hypothetical protein